MTKKDAFAYPERYARTIFDTTNLLSAVELRSTVKIILSGGPVAGHRVGLISRPR